jgi:PAS domain S-box-containing protein
MREFAEQSFVAVLEAAPDAMLCVDADGRIVRVNGQADQLFGYPRAELIGQRVELLVPDAARAVHPRHRAVYLADPRPRPMGAGMEVSGRRRDGSTFPAEICLSALVNPEGILTIAAVRDATDLLAARGVQDRLTSAAERDKSQARMLQAQRLENLGQLAGGIAHDFNNLLGVILNYASFVSEELAGASESDWEQRRETASGDLDQIKRAAERAAALTRQLLAFARREVVRPQVLDLDTVIAALEEMLRRAIGEHVQLVMSPGRDLWPILADPGQLEQVLVNLAVNARDAMPAGGTLTIDTSNITVDDEAAAGGFKARQGHNVRLRVSDTGTGMTREVIEHVFEPFFTTKEKGAGTGLGLATVYGILAQSGGSIQVYSELGTGTTFSILLPVTAEAAAPIVTPAPYQRTPAGETVLIVEDESALRTVTERIFTRNGYTVITAANGPDALDIARGYDGEIHLLVTDVVMPYMLGKEVAEKLREARPDIAVLFMSGYARPVLASQGRLEPGVALVEKPFSEADLLTRAGQVLSGHFRGYQATGGDPA